MERIAREAHTPNRMFPLTYDEFQTAAPLIVTPNAKQMKRAKNAATAPK